MLYYVVRTTFPPHSYIDAGNHHSIAPVLYRTEEDATNNCPAGYEVLPVHAVLPAPRVWRAYTIHDISDNHNETYNMIHFLVRLNRVRIRKDNVLEVLE